MGNKFRLGRKIGSGSFGEIYLGMCALLVLFSRILILVVSIDFTYGFELDMGFFFFFV